ncbi:MAG: hemerythrin domain-containing protein [Kofleriaceae bacterium]
MTPKHALTELLAQHAELREIMRRCEHLAGELDDQRAAPDELTREVSRLRVAFDAHNQFEEQFLRPILLETDAFGEIRIEAMVADHIGEHRALDNYFVIAFTSELRFALEELRHHLETEERYFLSSRVLRDDLVVVEGGG